MAGFAFAVTAATAQVIGLNVAMLTNPFGLIAVCHRCGYWLDFLNSATKSMLSAAAGTDLY